MEILLQVWMCALSHNRNGSFYTGSWSKALKAMACIVIEETSIPLSTNSLFVQNLFAPGSKV